MTVDYGLSLDYQLMMPILLLLRAMTNIRLSLGPMSSSVIDVDERKSIMDLAIPCEKGIPLPYDQEMLMASTAEIAVTVPYKIFFTSLHGQQIRASGFPAL